MPNNRFNKQVTPKGYMKGGRIKKKMGGSLKPASWFISLLSSYLG